MGSLQPPSQRHDAVRRTGWTHLLDRGAIGLSGLCLVHCLAFPVVIALLPALDGVLPRQAWVHPVILGLALPLAGIALGLGWRRHRDWQPGALGALGLVLMVTGLLAGEGGANEIILTVAGGLLLAGAHALNWHRDHAARFHPAPPRAE